jgi:hypothetical protein
MIRTRRAALAQSGNRFSEKIMLKQGDEIHDPIQCNRIMIDFRKNFDFK